MKIINTIGEDGCACGEYKSDNISIRAHCRKSSATPVSDGGEVYHLIVYTPKNDEGLKELGGIIDRVAHFGGDYVRVEREEQ